MRTSRTVSEVDKNLYPKCNLKKQHQKESLSLVCLTPTCKFRGSICVLCKKQHNGHNVIPLKTFVMNIQQALKKNTLQPKIIEQKDEMQTEKYSDSFKRLQEGFIEVMGMLKLQVLQLSQQIRRTQDKLIKQFQQIKVNLSNQAQKSVIIADTLQYFKQKQITDSLELRKYVSSLLKNVSYNKNQILISSDIDQIVNNYVGKIQVYKENIYNIQSELQNMFESLHQKAGVEKIKSNRPKTAFPMIGVASNKSFLFSSTLKASNVTLEKEGAIAKLKDNAGDKFVFVNNCISAKNNEITIKIIQLKGCVSLGVGLKDKIKQKAYKFQKNTIGHGAYLITSNSLKYSHSDKAQNGVNSPLALVTGDEIQLTLDLKCNKDEKKVSELSLKTLSENSWKQLQFCLVLSSNGDKVQII